MRIKSCILILVLFSVAFWASCRTALAQTDSLSQDQIAVSARPSVDSIVLRWAPVNLEAWLTGNANGYRIERYLISMNDRLVHAPLMTILAGSIKPWSEETWESLVRVDHHAAIAAQALFGDRFEIDLEQSDIFAIVDKVAENEQRFAFALFSADMSPDVARASGLWFTDRDINPGEKYLYRIRVNGVSNMWGSVFVGSDDVRVLPMPTGLRATFHDRLVSIRWDRATMAPYSAFVVERSHDGRNFAKVTDTPVVTLSPTDKEETRYEHASDSLPDNDRRYYYRVKGITPFGETGPSSSIVSGKGSAATGDVPYIKAAVTDNNTSIVITWDFPAEFNTSIRAFHVERTSGSEAHFDRINPKPLSPSARKYEDQSPGAVNYYRVSAEGIDGLFYHSHPYYAQLVDSIPPGAPRGLVANTNRDGRIALTWDTNPENDIYGYRIFRSWFLSHEPTQITHAPIRTPSFIDSVNLESLNEKVYYQLVAVDVHQNQSVLSAPLEVSLPDNVRPQSPVLLPLVSKETRAVLSWIAAPSEDIISYGVYRKASSAHDWVLIHRQLVNGDSIYSYSDKSCPAGKVSHYTVISEDDAGLESEPTQSVSRLCGAAKGIPSVTWRKPALIADENTVRLSWSHNAEGSFVFQIFRSTNNGPPMTLQTVDKTSNQYTDGIIPGNHYTYRIIACYEDGTKSPMSDALNIRF